jgi:hypothetical protein
MATSAPSAAKANAMDRPIPRLPPATTTFLPLNEICMCAPGAIDGRTQIVAIGTCNPQMDTSEAYRYHGQTKARSIASIVSGYPVLTP